jgi:hypothetical protein
MCVSGSAMRLIAQMQKLILNTHGGHVPLFSDFKSLMYSGGLVDPITKLVT